MDNGYINGKSVKQLVRDKMNVLHDFGICDRYDTHMMNKLFRCIAEHPEKEPREALDCYCRPLIQTKINSWTDV